MAHVFVIGAAAGAVGTIVGELLSCRVAVLCAMCARSSLSDGETNNKKEGEKKKQPFDYLYVEYCTSSGVPGVRVAFGFEKITYLSVRVRA